MLISLNRPKVTVLMSVYNDQGYLAQAVDSILNQSFRDFEFLIIDDGSTRPLSALESLVDPRIRVHRQKTQVDLLPQQRDLFSGW